MAHRLSSLLLAGLGLVGVACTGPAPGADRPNVLVVTLDTTRYDALGPYGGPAVATPTLNRLAAEGAVFDRAYTVTPLTIPSHSSIHTGLYPPRHGVRDNGDYFLSDEVDTLAEAMQGAGYDTMAAVGAEVTSHHWGFAQGFDTYHDDLGPTGVRENRWKVERPGQEVVDDALSWLSLDERAEDPWFAWVHLFDPHHPYEPVEPYATRFPGRPYLGEIAYTDAQVGRLIDHLDEAGTLDDTLVMVMADHGEGFGAHGEAMHGILLYDETMKVPLVVRPPGGLDQEQRIDVPATVTDTMPTVLAAAGLELPEGLDGVDLGPAWGEGELDPDRAVYLESLYAYHHYGWAPQHGLVDPGHKLIDSTTDELYAAGDRRERNDLVAKRPAVHERMVTVLEDRLEAMEASGSVEAGRAEMSGERVAQLQALGYVTSATSAPTTDGPLPDPVDRIPVLREVEKAQMAVREGKLEEAEELARAVLETDPGLLPPRQLLIDVVARQGRLDEALALAEQTVEDTDHTQARLVWGSLKLGKGDIDGAREQFEIVLERDPYLAPAWAQYLQLLYSVGDRPALAAALERAKAKIPDSPVVLAMEGALAIEQGNLMAGESQLIAALEADPKVGLAHYFLGVAAQRKGDLDNAEAEYLAEADLMPTSIPPRIKLVEIYGQQQRWEDQLEQLRVLQRLEPPRPDKSWAVALALFNLGRYDEAKTQVDRCREQWPTYANCALLDANVLAKLGKQQAAEAAFAEAQELAGQGE